LLQVIQELQIGGTSPISISEISPFLKNQREDRGLAQTALPLKAQCAFEIRQAAQAFQGYR
jgi:hypothetical protein